MIVFFQGCAAINCISLNADQLFHLIPACLWQEPDVYFLEVNSDELDPPAVSA